MSRTPLTLLFFEGHEHIREERAQHLGRSSLHLLKSVLLIVKKLVGLVFVGFEQGREALSASNKGT